MDILYSVISSLLLFVGYCCDNHLTGMFLSLAGVFFLTLELIETLSTRRSRR